MCLHCKGWYVTNPMNHSPICDGIIFIGHDGTEYGHHMLYVICQMEHEIYISTYDMCDHFTLITWNIS